MSVCVYMVQLTLVGSLAEVNATSRTASWKSLQQSKDVVPEVGLRIPSTLLDHASTLDAATVSRFAANIREGTLSQHSNEFCGAAKLTCDANMKVLDPVLRDLSLSNLQLNADLMQRTQEMIAASRAMYFGEKELTVGNQIHLPANLNRDIFPTISFLPSSLAQLMPFSRSDLINPLQLQSDVAKWVATFFIFTFFPCNFFTRNASIIEPQKLNDMYVYLCARQIQSHAKWIATLFIFTFFTTNFFTRNSEP